LQASARDVLASLAPLGPVSVTGSLVSGLMVWRDLDVMLLGGPSFSPHDVLDLLHRAVEIPGVTALRYADERGPRSPTGERRDGWAVGRVEVEHPAAATAIKRLIVAAEPKRLSSWLDGHRLPVTPADGGSGVIGVVLSTRSGERSSWDRIAVNFTGK
jgi:hypothetical protein